MCLICMFLLPRQWWNKVVCVSATLLDIAACWFYGQVQWHWGWYNRVRCCNRDFTDLLKVGCMRRRRLGRTGADVALFGCQWRVYQIMLWVVMRTIVNSFSSVKIKCNFILHVRTCPVAAANVQDDLLLKKTTFWLSQGKVATFYRWG